MRKHYYMIKTSILWNIGENYRENIYHYETKKDQIQGLEKISGDLERLIKSGEIKDFLIETIVTYKR